MHVGQFDVFFAAVVAQAPRRLGREAEQRLDRGRGARARLEFEHLTEQGQRDDDRRGLEIDADAAVLAERIRKPVRRQSGDKAVAECRRDAGADQGPHVRAAVGDGLGPAHEERRAGPEHDGRRQHEFQPGARRRRQQRQSMTEHGQHEHDQGQRQGPEEAAAEIRELGILAVVEARHHRFQRHAAERTGARMVLHDFRMHGTGVLRARRRRHRRCRRGGIEIALRIGDEPAAAAGRTEVVAPAVVVGLMRRILAHAHAADRIGQAAGGRMRGRVVQMAGVVRMSRMVRGAAVACVRTRSSNCGRCLF